nr:MAG: hypothetical protein [Microviridae sp.]
MIPFLKFNQQFDDIDSQFPHETNSGELLTEQFGYIPPKKQIEDMIDAGLRLAESRGQYDWDDDGDVDEMASDPTWSPNYDLADATQQQLAVQARLKASKKAMDDQIAKEAAEKAEKKVVDKKVDL